MKSQAFIKPQINVIMARVRNAFAGKMFYNTIDFNPVAIPKAFISDGEATKAKTIKWQEMGFKAG